MNSNADVWEKVLSMLSEELTETTVATWFDQVTLIDITDSKITLFTPVEFKGQIIRQRYQGLIARIMEELFSSEFDVEIIAGEIKADRPDEKPVQRGKLTFDNFIVGPSNKFAHAAAKAVSERPGQVYNPLLIYGESGLGKTHLLYAISNAIKEANPGFKVVYIRGDEFTNELISAISSGRNVEFREKYRGADLFLMDDIQFIAGRESTQEEFFHTFNTLYEAGKQIVLTSDRPPKEMARLENRLQTRFEWGLIADVKPPEFETRVAIIKKKASFLDLVLEDNQLSYIATNITDNVRQIEGTVNKIVAYQQLGDMDQAQNAVVRAVNDMKKERGEEAPDPMLIIEEVARFFSIEKEDILSKRKTSEVANARQYAMYLMRKLTNMSFGEIGRLFDRDHTTVMHATEKIESQYQSSAFARDTVRDITSNIKERA
ncbi:MAG: chromosomal replication initiator protein DnaA [Oscillospiraceae bacterium]|nr:chromosomal replication initiator protein DnaA [Oscillospiraceae bacterium]